MGWRSQSWSGTGGKGNVQSSSGRGGRGRFQPSQGRDGQGRFQPYQGRGGRGFGESDQKRRVFTKLVRDENATVSTIHQATRFLEGMESFDCKADLLAQLQDSRYSGSKRIGDVLSFINSIDDTEKLLIPLLDHMMTEETSRPVYRSLRDKTLLTIYNVPGLMPLLEERGVASDLNAESANRLCMFLRSLAKAFLEPRQSTQVCALARKLRERGDVVEAGVLCNFLQVDEKTNAEVNAAERRLVSPTMKKSVCWVTDMVLPGGRHLNDHHNFRNIRILPTVEELTCTIKPYLPLASGENKFLDDPETSLLDSNFRLLREDAVSSMKQALCDDSPRATWTNARIVGLDVDNKRSGWKVSLVVQCDSQVGGNTNWEQSRALMLGSVVALCREGVPVRIGTISVREYENHGEWLRSSGGPKIGVSFENLDFEECLAELVDNTSINNKSQRAAILCQLQSYDLKELSKSFFAYHPILKALQDREAIPLSNELVDLEHCKNLKPGYLPDRIALPREFGGYRCDLEHWSSADVVQHTTLDKSQADALHHALRSRVALIQGPPGTGK